MSQQFPLARALAIVHNSSSLAVIHVAAVEPLHLLHNIDITRARHLHARVESLPSGL